MPPLSVLIKPSSSLCNLKCKYCFYHSIAEKRLTESYGKMSIDTLESIVKKGLEYADSICTFAFQGGEPTLSGLDFFNKLIEFEKKYNIKKIPINNAIQTNGMVINDKWAQFFAGNKFLVGISLDGPKDIHDANRIDLADKGSYKRVMQTIDLFKKYGVEYNILTVINSYTARHINKIYGFFKKNNFKYLQFIPCLDPLEEEPGGHNYSLTPERYTHFLKTLFDLWYNDVSKDSFISIRHFDNLVGMFMGYAPESCGMLGVCSCQFVIEADGGVYPCDFYVIDEWYLGNINEIGYEELRTSKPGMKFVDVSKHVDHACRECRWQTLCRGGCRRSREPFVNGKPVLNYYCESYKEFYEYSAPRLRTLAAKFSQRI